MAVVESFNHRDAVHLVVPNGFSVTHEVEGYLQWRVHMETLVSRGKLRPEGNPLDGRPRVLSIGLFDGIGCLRVALDLIGANVLGHVLVQKQPEGHRVVEYHFPGSPLAQWCGKHWWRRGTGLVPEVRTSGHGHNGGGTTMSRCFRTQCNRRGALLDELSCLFVHVQRIRRLVYNGTSFGVPSTSSWSRWHPWMKRIGRIWAMISGMFLLEIDSEFLTWCRRPRLYWITWGIQEGEGAEVQGSKVFLTADVDLQDFIWMGEGGGPSCIPHFYNFSSSTKQAGALPCRVRSLWPWNVGALGTGWLPLPTIPILGWQLSSEPTWYFALAQHWGERAYDGNALGLYCPLRGDVKTQEYFSSRHPPHTGGQRLVHPSRGLVAQSTMGPMGLSDRLSPQHIMERLDPTNVLDVRSRLLRQKIRPVVETMSEVTAADTLEKLLSRLVSTKGKDFILSSSSDQVSSFQRLRQTVPARLWRWRIIAGWKWKLGKEHINSLELRSNATLACGKTWRSKE